MTILPGGMVGTLAEVVLRVRSLDLMQEFYAEVLGLPLWRRFGDDMVFFKLPAGQSERPQTLALFAESWPSNMPCESWSGHDRSKSTLHHIALGIRLEDLHNAAHLLGRSGVPTVERTFPWVGWRSLMLRDPETNTVELVASDPTILAAEPDQ
jgi:catechol 2,3-dioxygenase-like lactoylglutathione lyase family enzyme